ncbi:MAG: LysR family transcriptional regulator, partial [Mesorhizobium sp.]
MAALRNPGGLSASYEEPPGDGETLLRSGLSLRHMRMIAALDDHGRVSAAAQVMNISQPAASRMIAEMEAVLDVKLCERLPRGITLTPYG